MPLPRQPPEWKAVGDSGVIRKGYPDLASAGFWTFLDFGRLDFAVYGSFVELFSAEAWWKARKSPQAIGLAG